MKAAINDCHISFTIMYTYISYFGKLCQAFYKIFLWNFNQLPL